MGPNLVDAAGLEPTMPGAGDLQSPGVTNFPTHPLINIKLFILTLAAS